MAEMNPMMMMMMMQQMNQGSGSNGAETGSSDFDPMMMMRMMNPEMFEEETEALWSDVIGVGSARLNGYDQAGILAVTLLPPTFTVDRVTLRLSCPAPIKLNPHEGHFKKIGDAFLGMHADDSIRKRWDEAKEDEPAMRQQKQQVEVMKNL